MQNRDIVVSSLTTWGTVKQGSLQEGCVNLVHMTSPHGGGNWGVQADLATGPGLSEGACGDCRTAGMCLAERKHKQEDVFITTLAFSILKTDEPRNCSSSCLAELFLLGLPSPNCSFQVLSQQDSRQDLNNITPKHFPKMLSS